MRSRDEIEREAGEHQTFLQDIPLLLEALLDIREILKDKHEKEEGSGEGGS